MSVSICGDQLPGILTYSHGGMHVILTGPIGSGKSTAAQCIRERLSWTEVDGFYTRRLDLPDRFVRRLDGILEQDTSCNRRAHPSPPPLPSKPSFDVDIDALDRLARHVFASPSPRVLF
jgi:hypothetical protein